jgi:hypothetical protein
MQSRYFSPQSSQRAQRKLFHDLTLLAGMIMLKDIGLNFEYIKGLYFLLILLTVLVILGSNPAFHQVPVSSPCGG